MKNLLNNRWLPFEDAHEIVLKEKLKNKREYCNFIKNNTRCRFPYHPCRVYKKEWVSWYYWLGTQRVSYSKKNFLSFGKAHEIILKEAKKWKIDSQKKWSKYCNAGLKPFNIPRTVHVIYKNKGWVSYGHWLGTGNVRGAQRKYSVNHNFFKKWSRDMAYVLGFWFADGCICSSYNNGYTFKLTQHEKDKYLLNDIAKIMEASTYPLHSSHKNSMELCISSKEIYNDILKLGGKERKSMDVEFPFIPNEYLSDFVRGYFDGDGCIWKLTKDDKYRSNFVSGSLEFIRKLNEILSNELPKYSNGIKISYSGKIITVPEKKKWIRGKYTRFRKNYRLEFSINDTRRLRDFMYFDSNCIKLKRKYEKFLLAGNVRQVGGRVSGAKNKVHKM